jgi:hypothetical protein
MRKFSDNDTIFNQTSKDVTIQKVTSITGLPKEAVVKMYESMKIDNLSDTAVVEHFEKAAKPKNAITCSAFFGSLAAGISGVEGSLSDIQKTGVTRGILNALSDFTEGVDGNTMEPAELLATVKGLVEMKNPKAKDLLEALELKPVIHDFSKLNEAMQTSTEDTVQLYEGLRRILAKNNKRWGNAYHIEKSYDAIMKFVDEDAKRIMLEESIQSIDDSFHIELLNDLLSGNMNPIYKHINGVRQLIPDIQGLLFDLVILVNTFMQQNRYAMEYLSRINVQEYDMAARNLLASISSSRKTSKILDNKLKSAGVEMPKQSVDNLPQQMNDGYHKNFLEDCTNGIDSTQLNHSINNLPLKAIVDMLNLSKSMSSDFNLKIRPLIRNFVTKAYGITGRIERAKREVAQFKI